MMDSIRQWFGDRTDSEQRTLAIGAAALLLILLWLLFWQPLITERRGLVAARDAAQDDLVWMQNAAQRVQDSRSVSRARINAAPEVVLSRAAARYGLTLSRMEPAGSDRIEILFDTANYVQLLRYIAELEQASLTVDRLTLKRGDKPGLVQARLRMKKA